MALKATIFKARVQLADMDRGVYADHALTMARHPSETDERMMMRLLAFALNVPADDHDGTLEFAKGLSDTDEPDLWHRDLTGRIVHWIEIGQPDDKRLLRASRPRRPRQRLRLRREHADLVERHREQDRPRRATSRSGRSTRRRARRWPRWRSAPCSCR